MNRQIRKLTDLLNSSGSTFIIACGILAALGATAGVLYQMRVMSTSQMVETMQKDTATNDAMGFARATADRMQAPGFDPTSLNCGSVPTVKLFPGYEVHCYTNGANYMLQVEKVTLTLPPKSLGAVSMMVPIPGPSPSPMPPVKVDGGWSTGDPCICYGTAGQARRTHTCTNPAPANGGAPCAPAGHYTNCPNATASPLNCRLDGGWSNFGGCNKSCGGGLMFRACNNPTPLNGGTFCAGAGSASCNTQSCCSGTSSDSDSAKLKNGASRNLKANCGSGYVRKSCEYSGDCGKWNSKGSSNTSCTGTWYVPKGACGGGPETGTVKIKCGCP